MSEPLVVTIPHKLGREEALRRVKPALSKASESFPAGDGAGGGRQDSGGRKRYETGSDAAVAAAQIRSGRSENYRWQRPDPFGKEMTLEMTVRERASIDG